MEVIKRVGAGVLLITVLIAAGVMFPSSASVLVPPAYNLVQNNGTPLTRRTTLNCTTGMTCSDSGGVTTMAATGTGGSVTSVQVAANAPLSVGGTCTVTTTGVCTVSLSANNQIRSFGGSLDGGGNPLSSGKTTYVTVPFACTIAGYNILVDTGTVSFDVWKVATGTAIPTVSNSILTGGFLAIATGTALHSVSTALFTTTTVSANDIIGVNLQAASSATFAQLVIQCNATT